MQAGELRLVIPRDRIAGRVRELARTIMADYNGRSPVLIGVLKGSFMFMADLVRELEMPLIVEFIGLSTYGLEQKSDGTVTVTYPLRVDIKGRDVLVVEDIIDSGTTLRFLRRYLEEQRPASLRVCALLGRDGSKDFVDYLGFVVGKGWLVGYGLDSGERYRHLPDIYVLEEGER